MSNLFLALLVIGIATCIRVDPKFRDFQDFVKKYNKIYDSPEQFVKKFEVYKENDRYIKKNTPKKFSGSVFNPNEQRFGPNKFSDMTIEEFKEKYLTLDIEDIRFMEEEEKEKPKEEEKDKKRIKVPDNWDWRKEGMVSPVKNQDICGACWSYTTVATLESQHLMKTGKLKQYSEQQLIDCDNSNKACKGGLMAKSFKYLQNHSLTLMDNYPYTGEKEECKYESEKGLVKVTNYGIIKSKDEEEIKEYLYTKGPLAAAVNSLPLIFYWGGIFDPWFDIVCIGKVNHAVTIVGYGTEDGTDYWIVKNSWGKDWGEDGFFRIRRGKGLCGINNYVLWVEAEFNDNDK